MPFAFLIIGFVAGGLAAWAITRGRLQPELATLRNELDHERRASEDKVAVLVRAREELSAQLRSMCAEALRGNNEQFIQLAKAQFEQLQLKAQHDLDSRQKAVESLVSPIKES